VLVLNTKIGPAWAALDTAKRAAPVAIAMARVLRADCLILVFLRSSWVGCRKDGAKLRADSLLLVNRQKQAD
jgi:hypothetical protein